MSKSRSRRQPSKVDLLPPELREAIEVLWQSGRYTLEQLAGFLGDLAEGRRSLLPPELDLAVAIAPEAVPSKSGLGRHVKGLDAVAEKLERSRTVAEALVRKLGDEPESRTARLNIALLHSAVLDLFMAEPPSEENSGEGRAVAIDPEAAMLLGRTLKDLASANKLDMERTLGLQKAVLAKAASEAEKALKANAPGLTAETVNAIKAKILGVKV